MEAVLREAIESIAEGVIYQEAGGRIKLWNKAAESIFGLTAEQALGLTSTGHEWNLIHEDGSPCPGLDHPSMATLRTGQALSNQVRGIKRPDGGTTWLSMNTTPLFHSGGDLPDGVLTFFSDISRQRQDEADLLVSQEKLTKLFKACPMSITLTTLADGRYLDVNDVFLETTGLRREEVIGHTALELGLLSDPEYRQRYVEIIKRQGRLHNFEDTIRFKDGRTRQLLRWAELVEIGGEQCLINTAVDMTESKQAENQLRESQARYRDIFETNQAVKLVVDPTDGAIVEANQAACHFYGYSLPEFTTQKIQDLNTLPPGELEAKMASAQTEGRLVFNFRHRLKSGDIRDVEVYSGPIHYHGRTLLHSIVFDVTDRKRSEEHFRHSEELWRHLFQSSPAIVLLTTADEGRLINVNASFLRFTGYALEDILGKTTCELGFWSDPQQRDMELVRCLREKGEINEHERHCQNREGQPRTILWSAVPLEIRGQPCILNHGIDITRRKQAEKDLKESEERFRSVVTAMAEGVIMQDSWGSIQLCNPAAERILGMSREQIIGRTFFDPPWQAIREDFSPLPETEHPAMLTLSTGQPRHEVTIGVKRPDGALCWISLNTQPLFLPDQDEPFSVVSTIADITGRRLAEEQIRESGERITALFNATSDSVILLDPDCIILAINEQGAKRRARRPDELIGKPLCDLLGPELAEARRIKIKEMVRNGQPSMMEEKSGGNFYVIRMFPVLDSRGDVTQVACFSRDVTLRKQAEKEKDKLEAQLRQAHKMEAIGTMASGIAHDFNNILAVIMGCAELAQHLANQGGDNAKEIAQIMHSAERARNLVREIMIFGRKGPLQPRPLNLNKSVEATLELLKRTLPKMIDVEHKLEGNLALVNADPNQVQQIILNLASNAADSMPEGGRITVTTGNVFCEPGCCPHSNEIMSGQHVLLQFTDNGSGMTPEVLDQIFDPFFTTKGVGKGTGLGLSSVYGIVRSHAGHIHCESQPGLGATFKIFLPAHFEKALAPRMRASSPERDVVNIQPLTNGRETILLVEDEEHILSLGTRLLENYGYSVLQSTRGEQALEVYNANQGNVDLVVLDINMPGMGGLKCLRGIMEQNPRAKVLIASGDASPAQIEEILEAGAAGFVAKPYRMVELLGTMRQVLDR